MRERERERERREGRAGKVGKNGRLELYPPRAPPKRGVSGYIVGPAGGLELSHWPVST
jgi:hypothetical protein